MARYMGGWSIAILRSKDFMIFSETPPPPFLYARRGRGGREQFFQKFFINNPKRKVCQDGRYVEKY